MNRRFIFTMLTLVVIAAIAGAAVFLAKGYRLSTKTGTISGTGILSLTSEPDQASVYLDGHLTTATNANVNSLTPKSYDVQIVKEGYITWQKKVEIKEGLVAEVKATLYRAIPPLIYPLTYSGAQNPLISPDGQKLVYIIPEQQSSEISLPQVVKKSGIWVWQMGSQGFGLGRGSDQKQIALADGVDYSKAEFKWSPDSTQILISFPDKKLLLDTDKLNDPPRDITAVLQTTLDAWKTQEDLRTQTRFQLIKDLALRKTASEAAVLRWSSDETKILYASDPKGTFKVADLETNKTYDLPHATYYSWLGDSEHLVLVEEGQALPSPTPSKDQSIVAQFPFSKISIVEFDGSNKSEVYAGNFDAKSVVGAPDSSRIIILSSFATATASQPNLYGVNLR